MLKKITMYISSAIILIMSVATFAQDTSQVENAAEKTTSDAFRPYQATYKLFRKGSDLGEGFRELHKTEQGYQITSMSKISWLFLSDNRKETSDFVVENDLLTANNYRYVRTGTGRDREEVITFSPDLIQSTYKSNVKKIKPILYTYDPLLYQLALRRDLIAGKTPLSYHIVRKGNETQYRFERQGMETVNTPYGRIEAIKLARIRENSTRRTLLWIAPSLNYTVVKLTQFKDGSEQADLQLSSLRFN